MLTCLVMALEDPVPNAIFVCISECPSVYLSVDPTLNPYISMTLCFYARVDRQSIAAGVAS